MTKKLGIKKVDGIILDDVLEHLINPDKAIKILSEKQEHGNYLFLRQMNYDSLGRKLYGKLWYYFQPSAHMYYFNRTSITRLLNKNSYEIIKIYERNIFINIFMTVLMELWQLVFKREIKGGNHKLLTLTKRKKSYDDMFLVVARKC